MSQERFKGLRDQTLVLRVLVPGLHTSLNDKINSKKNGGDDTLSLSLSCEASGGGPQKIGNGSERLLNLEGVTCLPSQSDSTLWDFRCDGATYPARLVNIPCPVEVHKTHDHANFHKSADVGQMLIVYEDIMHMADVENEIGYKVDGFPAYFHSGLTPPMSRVLQRRYLSRFDERDTKPQPPSKDEVAIVEREILNLITKLSARKGKQKRTGGEASSKEDIIFEEVEEDLVDYETWMGEGGVFTMEEVIIHPECWLSKSELDEIDEDRRHKEQEAIRAAKEKEEQEKQKQLAKAEKKKKRKDKKKKAREEKAATRVAVEPEASASIGDHIICEHDEVTHIAMAAINGVAGDDFLFDIGGDDMFNFDNEDITDFILSKKA